MKVTNQENYCNISAFLNLKNIIPSYILVKNFCVPFFMEWTPAFENS